MTRPTEFPGYRECDKIPGADVSAYVEVVLDPENPTGIAIDSTWGYNRIDLESVVKAGETVTHLELAPENTPTVLRYFREDGEIDCVHGDDLSKIVSMQLLKDVDQTQAIADGDVYVYDEATGKFKPFEIVATIGAINTYLNRLNAEITAIKVRLNTIEAKLTPPENAPDDVTVAFGNRNVYGDNANNDSHDHGIYTHDPTTDLVDDLYFA